jgi:hypothetical protein
MIKVSVNILLRIIFMNMIRTPVMAGMFYPINPEEIQQMIQDFLQPVKKPTVVPKALIAPHAGYIYSGPIAATAYAHLQPVRDIIKRVILLGPSHRVAFKGLAVSSMHSFATPLGHVLLDRKAIDELLTLKQVLLSDKTHALEHSLEVHLPFLQETLDDFTLVPLVVGEATPEEVAEVLEKLWGGDETLIVISTDLSHYLDYKTACQIDALTSKAIENLQPEKILHDQACGRNPVNGLLHVARQRQLHIKTVDLRNSGDTAGTKDRVVGYGAYICL